MLRSQHISPDVRPQSLVHRRDTVKGCLWEKSTIKPDIWIQWNLTVNSEERGVNSPSLWFTRLELRGRPLLASTAGQPGGTGPTLLHERLHPAEESVFTSTRHRPAWQPPALPLWWRGGTMGVKCSPVDTTAGAEASRWGL